MKTRERKRRDGVAMCLGRGGGCNVHVHREAGRTKLTGGKFKNDIVCSLGQVQHRFVQIENCNI